MVQLRFDANLVKGELNKILERKVRAIKKDEGTYTELLETLYDGYIQPTLEVYVDTGAFAHATGGESEKTHYMRRGFKTISSHHGIERDAVEYRRNGEQHYFRPLIGRIYGVPSDEVSGKTIYDAMHSSMKSEFLQDASTIITRAMNNG